MRYWILRGQIFERAALVVTRPRKLLVLFYLVYYRLYTPRALFEQPLEWVVSSPYCVSTIFCHALISKKVSDYNNNIFLVFAICLLKIELGQQTPKSQLSMLQGITLLHHACIHNRPGILSILLGQNPNLSTRRTEINAKSTSKYDT